MRYILDNEGYIESIAFGSYIECNNKSCIEYTGSIPTGYESLCEWADNANIQAYYLVDDNLTYDNVKDEELQAKWQQESQNNQQGGTTGITLLDVYPVGSIYMSVTDVNPSTLFGGTWVAWGSGRVPVGVDPSQTEFATAEKTGGEKTHTLTINEMPNHNHSFINGNGTAITPTSMRDGGEHELQQTSGGRTYDYIGLNYTGGSQPHNNLQPYITCYMWKRTA